MKSKALDGFSQFFSISSCCFTPQVGGMFDMIMRNNAATSEWAVILVQLLSHDVVDCQVNR